jgi:hypothetical protein
MQDAGFVNMLYDVVAEHVGCLWEWEKHLKVRDFLVTIPSHERNDDIEMVFRKIR